MMIDEVEKPDLKAWMSFYSDYPFLKHRLLTMRTLIDISFEKDPVTGKRPKKKVTLNEEQIHEMVSLIDSFESMLRPLFDREEKKKRLEARRKMDKTKSLKHDNG